MLKHFDYTSDLHFDTHLTKDFSEEEFIIKYSKYFKNKKSIILVIAGDIGEDNDMNIKALCYIKKIFKYQYILLVLGNHDLYLSNPETINLYGDSFNRIKHFKNLIKKEKDIYLLDGNIIEIEGIRFGGTMGWYDGKYITNNLNSSETKDFQYINNLWAEYFPDFMSIRDINHFNDFCRIENNKIESIYKNCDVMITHINPSIQKDHTEKKYRENDLSGFFSFDGSRFLKDTTAKVWLFGHTHYQISFKVHNVICSSNPFGYPSEVKKEISVECFKFN